MIDGLPHQKPLVALHQADNLRPVVSRNSGDLPHQAAIHHMSCSRATPCSAAVEAIAVLTCGSISPG